MNKKPAGQNEDDFDNRLKRQMKQGTFIIKFTKLNVMFEIKTESNIFAVKKMEMVHCFTKPIHAFSLHKICNIIFQQTQQKWIEGESTLKRQ